MRDSAGSSALPLDPVKVAPWPGKGGVDVSYSAETGNPRLDSPQRFLHLQVIEQDQALPPGARPARLSGKSGLLAPASSRDYSQETYFANHVRFFWTERGVKYAATLHNFGAATKRLLGALIADLRPANELPSPRGSTSRDLKTIRLPIRGPESVAVGRGAVWVAGQGDGFDHQSSLARIDPDSNRVVGDRIRISWFGGTAAVAADRSVWVAHRDRSRRFALQRLDPPAVRFERSIEAGPELVALALRKRTVWAVDSGGWPGDPKYRGGAVDRVDAATNQIVAKTRVGRAPGGIAAGDGAIWVTNNLDDSVSRIDARTNRALKTIRVGGGPAGVAAGERAVWIANNEVRTLSRIDPATNAVVETIDVGRGPRGVAVGAGAVWVTNERDDTVSRIDPRTNRVVATIPVGAGPAGLAFGAGAVWVANNLDQTLTRIEP